MYRSSTSSLLRPLNQQAMIIYELINSVCVASLTYLYGLVLLSFLLRPYFSDDLNELVASHCFFLRVSYSVFGKRSRRVVV